MSSSSTLPSPPFGAEDFLHQFDPNRVPQATDVFEKVENVGHKRDEQTDMVRRISIRFAVNTDYECLCKMSLDGIDIVNDEQDTLFAKYSVDTVYCSYFAARNRVRQYTQLLALLKREENAWLQRVEKAKYALPGYKPQPEGVAIMVEV